MARGHIVKMSYWTFGLIRPEGEEAGVNDLRFNWRDVVQTTTDEQLRVGKIVEYALGRDRGTGKLKVTKVWPDRPDPVGGTVCAASPASSSRPCRIGVCTKLRKGSTVRSMTLVLAGALYFVGRGQPSPAPYRVTNPAADCMRCHT